MYRILNVGLTAGTAVLLLSVQPALAQDDHLDRDRGGPAIPVLPLPHHQACGSAPGGSVS